MKSKEKKEISIKEIPVLVEKRIETDPNEIKTA